MSTFRVDTKLFQELGELLVAKESTALVELVKNAYDADATMVHIHAQSLNDPKEGFVVVTDDGTGMNETDFEKGFLRIAGRKKVSGTRRSSRYNRRYTGEKGIGRLAAHKLGRRLKIVSVKDASLEDAALEASTPAGELSADIDWDAIEALETFDEIEASGAVSVKWRSGRPGDNCGTQLRISPLRTAWTPRKMSSFLAEAITLVPPRALIDAIPFEEELGAALFPNGIALRDSSSDDPGFQIKMTGDLERADPVLSDAVRSAHWFSEIDFDHHSRRMRIAVLPTQREGSDPKRSPAQYVLDTILEGEIGPSFSGRILQRRGQAWDPKIKGVRVYMEGFRVAPYGEKADDWLELDSDYYNRGSSPARSLLELEQDGFGLPEAAEKEGVNRQASSFFFGAVFLRREDSSTLQMLANREGFVESESFEFVRKWTKIATDLIQRQRNASDAAPREQKRKDRERQRNYVEQADIEEAPSAVSLRSVASDIQSAVDAVTDAITTGDKTKQAAALAHMSETASTLKTQSAELAGETTMLRVLASIGTELAAFVHEINAIGISVRNLTDRLNEARQGMDDGKVRRLLGGAINDAQSLSDRIKRNAAYLTDMTGLQGRRRRSSQNLFSAIEEASTLFEARLRLNKIKLLNKVRHELQTGAMFPAELQAILVNLLSNAVKFSGEGGKIRVRATTSEKELKVQIDNTGQSVDLDQASQWFQAFRSTTSTPDALLGQGMGLGLTITKSLLGEYGEDIRFVEPAEGYATSIRFSLPT